MTQFELFSQGISTLSKIKRFYARAFQLLAVTMLKRVGVFPALSNDGSSQCKSYQTIYVNVLQESRVIVWGISKTVRSHIGTLKVAESVTFLQAENLRPMWHEYSLRRTANLEIWQSAFVELKRYFLGTHTDTIRWNHSSAGGFANIGSARARIVCNETRTVCNETFM